MILKNKIALLSCLTLLSFTQSAHTKPVVEDIKDISQNISPSISQDVFQETLKDPLPDSIANQKKEQLEALKASAKSIGLKEKSDEETMLWGILGDQLLTALTAYENGDSDWAKAAHIPHDRVIEDRLILTAFDYDYSGQKRDFHEVLTQHGAKILTDEDPRAFGIEVPISELRELSNHVERLAIADYEHTTLFSAAWAGTNADWWQLTGRITGSGRGGEGRPVTIAIVDNFDERQFPDLISRRLIPQGTRIAQNFNPSIYNDHGNLMLALAYEQAPEARYILINIGNIAGSLAQGIRAAILMNPDIINTSLTSLIDRKVGPAAFPGPTQSLHEWASEYGILTVASAGNYASTGMHWSGDFIGSRQYRKLLNWNTQTASTAILDSPPGPLVDLAETSHVSGEVVVNDLGCLADSDSRDVPILISVGISPDHSMDYDLLLVKYNPSERGWRTVAYDNGGGINYSKRLISFSNHTTDVAFGNLIQADIPTSACGINLGRYGIVISKSDTATSTSSEPAYLNVFAVNNSMKVYNSASSIAEGNSWPETVTVGAADCIAPAGTACSVQGPTSYSSRGPTITFGRKPNDLNRNFLTLQSRSDLNSDAVKPDFVVPTPTLPFAPSVVLGTSGAAAIASGMTALLLDRYPQFHRNPSELKAALIRLAERSVGLQSIYARYSDDSSNPHYNETRASYKYGRGYLKLEKEISINMRGRPNHVRLNQNMTSSPITARTINGTETFLPASEDPPANMSLIPRYADGIGPQPAFYLTGNAGGVRVGASNPYTMDTGGPTRMLYPVLKPVVVFDPASFGGRATGARFMGGNTSTQLFPSDSRFSSSYLDTLKTAGYFSFPSLQFTANPTASPMIGQMYSLTMRAARRDGSLVPTGSTQANQNFMDAYQAALTRMMSDGTPINYLELGCPTCYVPQNTTATFNTCQAGYRPSLADTCPTTP
ncbi:MAG: S8 family serine peptidase [Deltaproteobacteria bacterium]|nr:MAG: S8 family serine peptidase [Deltaproteobacteria bacterium]